MSSILPLNLILDSTLINVLLLKRVLHTSDCRAYALDLYLSFIKYFILCSVFFIFILLIS